jgi:hypothetical protein
MSELSALAGSERYGVCEDEVDSVRTFCSTTESMPPEARAVASTEKFSVKRTAVINPQSAYG